MKKQLGCFADVSFFACSVFMRMSIQSIHCLEVTLLVLLLLIFLIMSYLKLSLQFVMSGLTKTSSRLTFSERGCGIGTTTATPRTHRKVDSH